MTQPEIWVCLGPSCLERGADLLLANLRGAANPEVRVQESTCRNRCTRAIVALARPPRRLLLDLQAESTEAVLAALDVSPPGAERRTEATVRRQSPARKSSWGRRRWR